MGTIADRALARSILPAAKFFALAGEVYEQGYESRLSPAGHSTAGIRADYTPSEQWQEALFNLYGSLTVEIKAVLGDDEIAEHYKGRNAWAEIADEAHLFTPFGWVHMIVRVINEARYTNGLGTSLGDPEFELMMSVIRSRIEAHRALWNDIETH